MPSVTAALNKLKEIGLIEYEKYGFIELTEKGRKAADRVYNKHICLSEFFNKVLLLDPVKAEDEACRVEHALEPMTCIQLHKFMQFARNAM
jgi:DtxR family Mn-dependent transcriptional regulator